MLRRSTPASTRPGLGPDDTDCLCRYSAGAGNNAPPAGSTTAIVIDHHPWRAATGMAGYVDIRVDVGATSTILTEYLQTAALNPTPLLATALFYGIKTDTRGLGGTTPARRMSRRMPIFSLDSTLRFWQRSSMLKSRPITSRILLLLCRQRISTMGLSLPTWDE